VADTKIAHQKSNSSPKEELKNFPESVRDSELDSQLPQLLRNRETVHKFFSPAPSSRLSTSLLVSLSRALGLRLLRFPTSVPREFIHYSSSLHLLQRGMNLVFP
jgi:hypothetical protein